MFGEAGFLLFVQFVMSRVPFGCSLFVGQIRFHLPFHEKKKTHETQPSSLNQILIQLIVKRNK